MKKILTLIVLALITYSCKNVAESSTLTTESKIPNDNSQKVFLIMLDGLRWQELFSGVDSLLLNTPEYTDNIEFLTNKFWRTSAQERRSQLMPFFWSTINDKGQIYGNRTYKNYVNVQNNHWFSYPGYNEVLCGLTDDKRINSNDKNNNPNQTILELVNQQPQFKGKVGAFGSWDVFPYIINEDRAGFYVNAGYREAKGANLTTNEKLLNKLQKQAIRPWESVRQDVFTHNYALEFIKKTYPKLLFISYGETDDFAHDGNYTQYLLSANNTDAMIKELWDYCQSNPYYKNKTTFIITTDHGRGTEPLDSWKSHGKAHKNSDETWIAAIGPNLKAKGEVKAHLQLYNSQIAATIQHILGINVLPDGTNQTQIPFSNF